MTLISPVGSTIKDDLAAAFIMLYEGNSPFGVTQGGITFDPKKDLANVEFDGKIFPVAELDYQQGGEPTLSGTFVQIGSTQLAAFESGATVTEPGSGNVDTLYTPKAAAALYASGDYLTNLRAVCQRLNGGLFQVRFPVAFCTQYQIVGADKGQLKVQATFVARQSLSQAQSDLGVAPYVLEELSAIS